MHSCLGSDISQQGAECVDMSPEGVRCTDMCPQWMLLACTITPLSPTLLLGTRQAIWKHQVCKRIFKTLILHSVTFFSIDFVVRQVLSFTLTEARVTGFSHLCPPAALYGRLGLLPSGIPAQEMICLISELPRKQRNWEPVTKSDSPMGTCCPG